jgi:hypothetical protein
LSRRWRDYFAGVFFAGALAGAGLAARLLHDRGLLRRGAAAVAVFVTAERALP